MGYFNKLKSIFTRKKKVVREETELEKRMVKDLLAALNLIVNEDNWCQKALARNAEGERLFDPSDETATSWDILGALHKVDASKYSFTFLRMCVRFMGYRDLDRYNDSHRHIMVVLLFSEAFKNLGHPISIVDLYGEEKL